MIIRAATAADADEMARLRAASIRLLCRADHHDDPAAIADWVGHADKFVHLLERPEAVLIVAHIDGAMAGLAGLSGDMVTLNYVHPDFVRRGVGRAMLETIEARLAADGITQGRLKSTATARDFYRALGWVDAGAGSPEQGYPMIKALGQSVSA